MRTIRTVRYNGPLALAHANGSLWREASPRGETSEVSGFAFQRPSCFWSVLSRNASKNDQLLLMLRVLRFK